MASDEPMASPSGRMCDVITNRCRLRISSATCARVVGESVAVVVIRSVGLFLRCGPGIGLLVCGPRLGGALRFFLVKVAQDLLDAVLVGNRLVETELELRNPAQ